MKLIADAGSTKTTWSIVHNEEGEIMRCETSGINPVYQSTEDILQMLQNEFLAEEVTNPAIYYYGAGCINDSMNAKVKTALSDFFESDHIEINTDMLGAARALCGKHEGIACILGTGSNSCYYNGSDIVSNVSPLGYILGDEGSGAVIGKRFIADLLKNQLPGSLKEIFFKEYGLHADEIINRVYREPFPNRFLSKFTVFILEHIQEPSLDSLVKNCFADFFLRNIRQYPQASQLPVNFTGSIAFFFKSQLKKAARETGYKTGAVTRSPMEGLINYHTNQKS